MGVRYGVMSLLLAFIICLGPGGMAAAGPAPAGNPGNSNYQVFAFNNLGMHCYDQDFSVFSLLPPFNVVLAQVIQKDLNKPVVLDGTAAPVTYKATTSDRYYYENGVLKIDSNSINTTSRYFPGTLTPKRDLQLPLNYVVGAYNFWDFVGPLYKVYGLPTDTGILWGLLSDKTLAPKMPGDANTAQPFIFDTQPPDPNLKWFAATGIPITNIDDKGFVNCFPRMTIAAKDSSLDIVVPASSEMNCAACHETAAFVVPGVTASDASPPPRVTWLSPTDFSMDQDPQVRFRENILKLHDALSGTNLYQTYYANKYDSANASPILCAQCHYSKALDLAGAGGPTGDQVGHLYLSQAMHKHHGTAWPVGGGGMGGMGGSGMASSGYLVPIPGTGAQQCYYCHPGNDTQCLRSVMALKGIQCQSCHGGLLAVAGFTSQLGLPHGVDRLPLNDPSHLIVRLTTGPDAGKQRQPWVDMPKCQSCHTGDALTYLGSKIVGTQAYAPQDAETASPIMAPNSPFADNNGLYRFSQTHGRVACEACHNSTHAEWPSRAQGNDNRTPIDIQGYPAEITECGACHTGGLDDPNKPLGGPHGLHSVNFMPGTTSTWPGLPHGVAYNQDPRKCQTCHGRDLKGTVLSRAKAERALVLSQSLGSGPITISAGTPVNCYGCHKMIVH